MSQIKLLNVPENGEVFHEIFQLKCQIQNFDKNRSNILEVKSKSTKQQSEINKKGLCKVLLQLQVGYNNFTLKHEESTENLEITYSLPKVNKSLQILSVHCRKIKTSLLEEGNCQKLLLGLKLVQCMYAEKLFDGTGVRKTFSLEPKVQILSLDIDEDDAHKLSELELWNLVARTLITSDLWNEATKYVAFISFTKYLGIDNDDFSYLNIKKQTRSNPALSSGGLALLGTGCLYTWPMDFSEIEKCFKDSTVVDMKVQLDDSNYRRTYAGCFSTTLGSVAHELGHIFDLGHTPGGIMGNGLDYIGRVFLCTDCLRTEDLPDRKVGEKNIEKQQRESTKFTKIKTPGKFLEKYHQQLESDLTYFEANNVAILFYHNWFNESTEEGELKYEGGVVKSKKPLAVVEIRKNVDQMTLAFKVFEKEIYEFEIKQLQTKKEQRLVLFAGDICGTTLKLEIIH